MDSQLIRRKTSQNTSTDESETEEEYPLWTNGRSWGYFDSNSKIWVEAERGVDGVYIYYKADQEGPLLEDRFYCLTCYHWSYVVVYHEEPDFEALFELNKHLPTCLITQEPLKREMNNMELEEQSESRRNDLIDVITIDDSDS